MEVSLQILKKFKLEYFYYLSEGKSVIKSLNETYRKSKDFERYALWKNLIARKWIRYWTFRIFVVL